MKHIIRYMMLLAGIIVLVSVIVPHHHHEDGFPCYKPLAESHHANKAHGCCCDGHNLAFFSSLHLHVSSVDANMHLYPLAVLFDYINPPMPVFCESMFERESAVYIESLHDTWIVSASGLRAPPLC
ncbi:DUF6769 family protein [Parabacteroides bouchesdurhonensis]|uniref:DUF6769 family protein n=1 Tax=Parabacteroides bouchesdurhonensis TaxID=1936995 RepID=UPI001D0C1FB5|nr:DUF6769 family protein [Parabacteroides bouchesdurhonensis]